MNKTSKYLLCTGMVFLLMSMIFLGQKAYTHAIAYEDATTELVLVQGVQEQAKRQLEGFAKSILGDLFLGEREVNFEKTKEKQHLAKIQAQKYTLYFMFFLGVVLLSFFVLTLREFVFFNSISAMITLVFGLISPILMVTIHQEVEYLGDIVLSFESKGIIGSILKLLESGDIIVALVILLFSVIVPVLKVTSLLTISIFKKSQFSHVVVNFFKMIGKWSMVDVFVVAVFLVYLTSNNADVTRAEIEVGLYFFLAYVIVSMLLSVSADRMMNKKVI